MYKIAISYNILVCLENHTWYWPPPLQERKIRIGWSVDKLQSSFLIVLAPNILIPSADACEWNNLKFYFHF